MNPAARNLARAVLRTLGRLAVSSVRLGVRAGKILGRRPMLGEQLTCRTCGFPIPTIGLYQCGCGFSSYGSYWTSCEACGETPGWIDCPRCAASNRNPLG